MGDDERVDTGYREVVLRPRGGQAIAVVVLAICVLAAAGLLLRGDSGLALHALPPLALVAFGAWMLFFRPAVRIAPDEIEIVNPLRTVVVPWPAIADVETQWGLVVSTARGRFTAWAAPRGGAIRRTTPASRSSVLPQARGRAPQPVATGPELAGALALAQWTRHRDQGLLEPRRSDDILLRWHGATAVVLGLLAIAALACASVP